MPPEFNEFPMSLEDQYANPMEVTIQGSVGPDGLPEYAGSLELMKIYDLVPPEQKSPVPVVILPGWTGRIEGLRENMFSLCRLGRRVISIGAPHGITPNQPIDGYPLVQARKISALKKAMDIKELDRLDLVAHSEGALIGTIAAVLNPERFRHLILVSPAGLIGPDSWGRLLTGFGRDVYEQLTTGVKDKVQLAGFKATFWQIAHALQGRANRQLTLAEVQAIINSHIEKLLISLKQQGHGIIIIHNIDDHEFPMDRIQQTVTGEMVHGFLSVRGHHHEMFRQPELFSKIIDQMLTALEQRRQ